MNLEHVKQTTNFFGLRSFTSGESMERLFVVMYPATHEHVNLPHTVPERSSQIFFLRGFQALWLWKVTGPPIPGIFGCQGPYRSTAMAKQRPINNITSQSFSYKWPPSLCDPNLTISHSAGTQWAAFPLSPFDLDESTKARQSFFRTMATAFSSFDPPLPNRYHRVEKCSMVGKEAVQLFHFSLSAFFWTPEVGLALPLERVGSFEMVFPSCKDYSRLPEQKMQLQVVVVENL